MKHILFLFSLTLFFCPLKAQVKPAKCSKHNSFINQHAQRTSLSEEQLQFMDQYDVHYYKIDIAAERTTVDISGNSTIEATVVQGPLSTFVFELGSELTIDSLRFNGILQTFTRTDSCVSVALAAPLSNGAEIKAVVYYRGTPSAGVGNGNEPFHNQPITWTLSEPYNSYHWFAVKQFLTDKADSVEVWITTSDENKAGSNGLLKNITALPGNKNRYEWKSNYPIAYYLISITVGQFMDYTLSAQPLGASQPIPIVNYIYDSPEALAYFKTELDKTPDMLDTYSNLFGLYPFSEEKYGHCTAPIGGGMEHQTMTTVNDFFTGLTAHELAHQWFGNHVTCATWKDIWLNEGFASYSEYLYHETDIAANAQDWLTNAHSTVLSEPTGSVYIDDTTNVGRIFDGRLTYKKGGLLLHMLRFEIDNDALFFQGLKNYQQTYSHRTATQNDFKQIMETTTGMNFDTFFNHWYFGSGYPIISATWNHSPEGLFYLQLSQIGSDATITPIYATSLQIQLQRSDAADTLIRCFIDHTTHNIVLPAVQGTVTNIVLDPNEWLINSIDEIVYDPSLIIASTTSSQHNKRISLFPNPASEEIRLSIPENYRGMAKLYDSLGQELKTFSLDGKMYTLKTNHLSPGLYMIVLQEGRQSIRFIKE
ncbi:MAG: hypothetical protein K0R51_466 [Cytophagaceae bacterium]|jgi:aminopeptidase N|nr:hypothetical protein [Cytophagaceae bacterium]